MTVSRRLRGILYLPLALARFALGLGAFAIIGPLQILNASRGMRQLQEAEQAIKSKAAQEI